MNAAARLEQLDQDLSELATQCDTLRDDLAERVAAGDDVGADDVAHLIREAEQRIDALKLRRPTLEGMEQDEAREAARDAAQRLAKQADAYRENLAQTVAEAVQKAQELSAIVDRIGVNAALEWAGMARQARQAGAKVERQQIEGAEVLRDLLHKSGRHVSHVVADFSQRSANLP